MAAGKLKTEQMKADFQRCLVFVKLKFRQIRLKEITTYCIEKLIYFFSNLKKSVKWIFENPQIISIIAFFGFVTLLGYTIFSDQIFVENVEIQGEAKDQGFTGELLTEQAVALLPKIVNDRLDKLPSKTSFLQLIKKHSDKYDTEQICNFSIPLFPFDQSLFLTGLDRVEMSSKTPDQVITSQSVSIKKLAYWIRRKFNLGDVKQLKPILWRQNNKYVLKVIPLPNDVPFQKISFEILDDAPKLLASIFIDYISPEIVAAELADNGLISKLNFNLPEQVAKNFLNDSQKELRIINTKIASQLDFSKTHADIKLKFPIYEKENQKLLNELDFNIFKNYGIILKTLIANRILSVKCYANCSNEIVDKYLGKYREDLEQNPYGLLTLLFLDAKRKDLSFFYSTLDKLLKINLRK
jgi:hypothetical protein